MIQTVNFNSFDHAFIKAGRADNFSYQGRRILFDYLESYEDDTGEQIELDVVALCCDYSEDDDQTIATSYGIDISEARDENESKGIIRDYLEQRTTVCGETDTGFVYASF